MTAKEYLLQLRKLQRNATNKQKEYKRIKESLSFLQGIAYDKDRVQTSPKDTLSETITSLVDAENEAVAAIAQYIDMYNDCVNKINSLSRYEYVEILSRRYLEDDYKKRRLVSIACDLNYSYERTKHMHGEALQEFSKKYLEC